jgi:membrane protein YdbS with pleckstrin-like domain
MERGSFLSGLKKKTTRYFAMTHISRKTKMIIVMSLHIFGSAFSLIGILFMILLALIYSTSNNLSFVFSALAFAFMFIVFFIIIPEVAHKYFDP